MTRFPVALLILLIVSGNCQAEHRVALIICNTAYNQADATSHATRVQQLLDSHGFHCSVLENVRDDHGFRNPIEDFARRTPTLSTAVVYYRGRLSDQGGLLAVDGRKQHPLENAVTALQDLGGSARQLILLDTGTSTEISVPRANQTTRVLSGQTDVLLDQLPRLLDGKATSVTNPPGRFDPGRKTGDEWVNHRGMVYRWCEPGEFVDSAGRLHAIEDGFWMMKYELRRGQRPGRGDLRGSPGSHKLHALGNFSFRDIPRVLRTLTTEERKAGRLSDHYEYALPTEAQWEYAARAGAKTAYSFGDAPAMLMRYANFADLSYYRTGSVYSNYGHRTFDDGEASVAHVGSYRPNAWGFYDMHGNVSEFCENGACRGGSWISPLAHCRFDFRDGRWGHHVGTYQGYRFVIRKVRSPSQRTERPTSPAPSSSSGAPR